MNGRSGLWRHEGLHHWDEIGQVCGDHLPDDVLVDTKIVVHDFVSHPDDVRPGDLGMHFGEFL